MAFLIFELLPIGAMFVCPNSDGKTLTLFQKKSLSSAYTLNPDTQEQEKLPGYYRSVLGFHRTVHVIPVRVDL